MFIWTDPLHNQFTPLSSKNKIQCGKCNIKSAYWRIILNGLAAVQRTMMCEQFGFFSLRLTFGDPPCYSEWCVFWGIMYRYSKWPATQYGMGPYNALLPIHLQAISSIIFEWWHPIHPSWGSRYRYLSRTIRKNWGLYWCQNSHHSRLKQ